MKNDIFRKNLKTKSNQYTCTHQNAPNCTILKKILGGACPQTPLRHIQISKSKKKFLPPPLPNPGYAPGTRGNAVSV